jgi:acetyl-CoA synthetase
VVQGSEALAAQLREYMRMELAPLQSKSRGGIEFVTDLPRTGKIRRVELRQQEAARIGRL